MLKIKTPNGLEIEVDDINQLNQMLDKLGCSQSTLSSGGTAAPIRSNSVPAPKKKYPLERKYERVCQNPACGKIYKTYNPDGKYCSKQCSGHINGKKAMMAFHNKRPKTADGCVAETTTILRRNGADVHRVEVVLPHADSIINTEHCEEVVLSPAVVEIDKIL